MWRVEIRHLSVAAGYSQSKSSPSKLYSWRNPITDSMKVSRDFGVDAIAEYFFPPSFHPPIAIITFENLLTNLIISICSSSQSAEKVRIFIYQQQSTVLS